MTQQPVQPDPFEMDDAAYLLGALSPAERARYEQHLQTCDACSRSLTELAGVPGVLRRLPIEVVRSMDDDEEDPVDWSPAPPTVLARVLERGELEERRARRVRAVRWASALTTAAAAVVVGVMAFVLPDPGDDAGEEPPTSELALEPLTESPMTANVSLRDVAWGTKIEIECTYEDGDWPDDIAYSLVVHETDGGSQQVASWNALAGREFTIDAATAVREADILAVEIQAEDGTPLLRSAD